MNSRLVNLRLQQLVENIEADFKLLNEFQAELRYENRPDTRAQYLRRIESLRESAERNQREYDEISAQVDGSARPVDLQHIDAKLNAIATGINELLSNQQLLLDQYDQRERRIIEAITADLDRKQIETIQTLVGAVEANRLSEAEMKQLVAASQEALAATAPSEEGSVQRGQIESILDDVSLDVKHKLKL